LGRCHTAEHATRLVAHVGQRGAFLLHPKVTAVGGHRGSDQAQPDADLDANGGVEVPHGDAGGGVMDDPVEDQER
jgi:hypothetical protein